ncbi:hypothetical protein DUI87_32640 [Hirundo rustica rustica]|uniref:Uncharacterized protein n=1 Tax=Hirundo rustica rustica TaxID=333673 RepID=A0A3M0IRC4_HIRRU|nr:hypothetical protein DUI87_32640 [Hirundo rustica rustica]
MFWRGAGAWIPRDLLEKDRSGWILRPSGEGLVWVDPRRSSGEGLERGSPEIFWSMDPEIFWSMDPEIFGKQLVWVDPEIFRKAIGLRGSPNLSQPMMALMDPRSSSSQGFLRVDPKNFSSKGTGPGGSRELFQRGISPGGSRELFQPRTDPGGSRELFQRGISPGGSRELLQPRTDPGGSQELFQEINCSGWIPKTSPGNDCSGWIPGALPAKGLIRVDPRSSSSQGFFPGGSQELFQPRTDPGGSPWNESFGIQDPHGMRALGSGNPME